MTTTTLAPNLSAARGIDPSARMFVGATVALAALAALLAGWLPLGFSIITVFLFAGPHNWFEIRYFLSRLPARWGKLRSFFLVGLGGVALLTAAFVALPWIGAWADMNDDAWLMLIASWNTLLVAWILILIQMRGKQNPRRDWFWTLPVGFALLAVNWLWPLHWDLGLVYLHPLMALWILDREIQRSRPEWRGAYHFCLALLPFAIGCLWIKLHNAPPLPGTDALSARITEHAGAGLLHGVSTHFLVSTHTFLEMLHYSVWLVAIPLVSQSAIPWNLNFPLARRSLTWRRGIVAGMACSACVVVLLWAGFLADYPWTRDVYFTVAIAHVLAEVPFLLRSL